MAYLGQGAIGLPVFAGGIGAAAFVGPTAGFLVGFLALAWIAGLAAGRGLAAMIGAAVAGSVALYAFGLAWPLGLARGWPGSTPAGRAWGRWACSTAS